MKAKMKLVNLLMILMVSISIFSCSDGEDGADGINGADGVNGVDGVNGADGEDGEDGEQGVPGTANVIYSDWIDSPLDGDIPSSTANGSIDVAGLSQEIFDQGTVLVYGKAGTLNVFALPFIGEAGVSYYYRLALGSINIRLASVDGSSIGNPLFGQYRYVLIPGGVEASTGIGGIGSKTATVDFTKLSYEEVIAHFNIPE
ncbi:collagen-like protein [Arenibacter sp. ARW7G5Y1]|uniref:collagen-like protein n=1 Tax=Arenibacter sp. ARW7G5Y1 TaxID=2135619 RepID=UPI000D756377|nr:collagen-like protein [Arenibacter sp. ARW7G5Y1]|tara:strand:+ start:285 stop:887 length:603 start_codon:yes stop_codon:yes gene_type:complete